MDDRKVQVMAHHLGDGKFQTFIRWEDDELIVMKPTTMPEGLYVGATAASPEDLELALWTTVTQFFSTAHILARLREVLADLQNAMSSVHKYFVILEHANASHDFGDAAMIRSEIEFAFTNYRSMFDQLNKVVLGSIQIAVPRANRLPDSFADVVKWSEPELLRKFRLTPMLATFFASRARTFLLLRDVRDDIIHYGHSNEPWIFGFPDGFGVDVERGFLSRLAPLNLWPAAVRRPGSETIASLLALFAFMVDDMLRATVDAAVALTAEPSQLPPSLLSGHTFYLRSPLTRHAFQTVDYLKEQWITPDRVLPKRRDR